MACKKSKLLWRKKPPRAQVFRCFCYNSRNKNSNRFFLTLGQFFSFVSQIMTEKALIWLFNPPVTMIFKVNAFGWPEIGTIMTRYNSRY